MKSKRIPKQYLYLLVDHNNTPFYLGYTDNHIRRLKQHQADFRNNRTKKFNNLESFTMEIIVTDDSKYPLKALESYLIIHDYLFNKPRLYKNGYIPS